jgi:hypothetical protein
VTTLERLLAGIVTLTAGACSLPPTTIPSGAPCQYAGLREAQALDRGATLAAAFVASRADVASWAPHGYASGSIRLVTSSSSGAPLDRVDVCYYDGAFNVGGHPIAQAGPTTRPYDRLLVTVDAMDGVARVATAGFHETMPLASPPHGP